jgi:ketosteroid isomerase-like protein
LENLLILLDYCSSLGSATIPEIGCGPTIFPSPAERDELFKRFARALFRGDMDALYQVVTPDFLWSFHDGLAVTKSLQGPDAIAAHLDQQKALLSAQRFHDVVYHHAGDTSFMTFRVSETARATGEQRAQRGIERYSFADHRLATKDVYRKPF